MKKPSALYLAVLCLAALAFPPLLSADEAGVAAEKGAYTIKQGDTLWDLSGSYLRDPFLWKEIWKLNPAIKDPDLIYPGERLMIPGITGEAIKATGPAPAAPAGATPATPAAKAGPPYVRETGKEEPFVNMGKTIIRDKGKKKQVEGGEEEKAPVKQPIETEAGILEAGFILADLDGAATINSSPAEDRAVFSAGDEVYITDREEFKEGESMVIFRPLEGVDDPATGHELGTSIQVAGLLQLKERKDGHFLGVIKTSISPVYIDDRILPYKTPELVYEPVPKDPGLKGKWGYVAALKGNRDLGSQGGVVYLDLGKDDGVKPGDRFIVRRSGGADEIPEKEYRNVKPSDYKMPDVEAGEVQVIAVQDRTSTALVTGFSEVIRVGHRVYYKD